MGTLTHFLTLINGRRCFGSMQHVVQLVSPVLHVTLTLSREDVHPAPSFC